MASVILAAALAAQAPPNGAPAPGAPARVGANVITQPDWLRRPDGAAMAEHYPKLATALGIAGYSVLSCTVGAEGQLTDCRANEERPKGLGFGRAAVELSSLFRMRPMTLNGRPVDGGKINIPIRFQLPTDDALREPPAPVSDEAAKQALRLVDSSRMFEQTLGSYEARAREIETLDPNVPPALGREAADDMRQAIRAHKDDFRTAWSRAYASVFSDGELSALADFYGSPAAAARRTAAFSAGQSLVDKEYLRNVTTAAHRAFCAKAACDTAADIRRVWRPADPRNAALIDIPLWDAEPPAARIRRVEPRLGGLLGLTGVVRMTCRVGDKGGLVDCSVDEQAPAGLGYGAAALKLSGEYRLSPILVDAGAAGRRVTVRVGFAPPPQGTPYRPPGGDPQALPIARQYAKLEATDGDFQLQTELQITDMATNPPPGVDDKLYTAGVEALRAGVRQAVDDFVEQSAENLSSLFTAAQMQAFVAFRATPAGQAERARRKELMLAMSSAQQWVFEKVSADMRTAFCAQHDCSPAPAPAQASVASSAASTRKP
jgi:TonB family protein